MRHLGTVLGLLLGLLACGEAWLEKVEREHAANDAAMLAPIIPANPAAKAGSVVTSVGP